MTWVLLAVLLLVAGAVIVVVSVGRVTGLLARRAIRRRHSAGTMRLPQPRCLRCHGTGWLEQEPERTFNFTGEGFEDRHSPAVVCPDCGGTGRVSGSRL